MLPSLGESGVVSVTANKLYAGILTGRAEPPEVAELKGRADMVPFLARAIADRQRCPREGLTVYYGSRRVDLTLERAREFFERSQRHRSHNDGAAEFRSLVIDALSAEVYDPSFRNVDDARETFRASRPVTAYLLRHFPPMTPERALHDLFGSPALLQSAATATRMDGPGVTPEEALTLLRPRVAEEEIESIRWSAADGPLLDELLFLLGGSMGQSEEEQLRLRDEADEFQRAAQADEDEDAEQEPVERTDDDDDVADGLLSFDDPYFSDGEV